MYSRTKKSIRANQQGAVMIIFGLVFVPVLLLLVGVAIDMARLYTVENRAQNASDAALLGAVATAAQTPVTEEYIRLLNANMPANYMGSIRGTPVITAVPPGNPTTFSVQFEIDVPMTIMSLRLPNFSTPSQKIIVGSQVSRLIENSQSQIELTLSLDVTGSMGWPLGGGSSQSKISALREASVNLTEILFGGKETLDNVSVSVVPWNLAVNLGSATGVGQARRSWIRPDQLACFDLLTSFTGQVYATTRMMASPFGYLFGTKDELSDTPPSDVNYTFMPVNNEVVCLGSELSYTQWPFSSTTTNTRPAPILFAEQNRNTIINYLNNMEAYGNTRTTVGLQWGWMTLSPKWQNVWSNQKPAFPRTPGAQLSKILVFMTDGVNTQWPQYDNDLMPKLCSAIKASGITIYTIGFGPETRSTEPMLKACANEPSKYFYAPTVAELKTIFKKIGDEVLYKAIRLSK